MAASRKATIFHSMAASRKATILMSLIPKIVVYDSTIFANTTEDKMGGLDFRWVSIEFGRILHILLYAFVVVMHLLGGGLNPLERYIRPIYAH